MPKALTKLLILDESKPPKVVFGGGSSLGLQEFKSVNVKTHVYPLKF